MEKILNVLYQTDDRYALPAGVSLTSLLMNNADIGEINVYLLNDGISPENLRRFEHERPPEIGFGKSVYGAVYFCVLRK